ncbi:MAG TPA: dTDP-glucose 4,6-dehydratase [Alphaproteobacteria bacterium]
MTHEPRRLLVTGGTGFIGANFILRALAARPQWRIVNLDKLTYAADPANLGAIAEDRRYRFIHGDVCDFDLLTGILTGERIDTVIHFAAESHVDRSIAEPAAFVRSNVAGTQTLLEACRSAWTRSQSRGVRFHHISTDEVFGSLASADPPFSEASAYAPNSPYSASKAAADHFVHAYAHTYGIPAIITNCSNNYGPRQHPEKFIPTVIRKALAGEAIPVYGSGTNVRDWLYVDDHCDALLTALEHAPDGARYCIGGGCEMSNIDLAHRLCSLLDDVRPGEKPHARLIQFVPDRLGHDFRYAIDGAKMRDELGWSPSTRMDDGLRRTVAWYLAQIATAAAPAAEPGSLPRPAAGHSLLAGQTLPA